MTPNDLNELDRLISDAKAAKKNYVTLSVDTAASLIASARELHRIRESPGLTADEREFLLQLSSSSAIGCKALQLIDSQAAALAGYRMLRELSVRESQVAERDAEIERLKAAIRSVIEGNWSLTGLQEVLGDLNESLARGGG